MAAAGGAQDFCKEVQKKKDILGDITTAVVSVVSPMALIGNLLGKLGTSTKSVDVIKNNISNEVSSVTRNKVENACANAAIVKQYNVVDNTECVKTLGCGADGLVKVYTALSLDNWSTAQQKQDTVTAFNLQCGALLNGTNINKQINSFTGQQNCTIDGVLTILSSATLDSSLMAILQKTQEAKGLMASTNSTTNSCNNISNKASVENYTETYQKCGNALNLDQSNVIKCRGGNNDQQNTYEQVQNCILASKVSSTASVASKAAAASTMDVKQKASSDFNGALIAIALIILAAGGVYALITFGPEIKAAMKEKQVVTAASSAALPGVPAVGSAGVPAGVPSGLPAGVPSGVPSGLPSKLPFKLPAGLQSMLPMPPMPRGMPNLSLRPPLPPR